MQGIEKSFSMVRVLQGVDLRVNGGSVHALMGENGAGKSTLMKILAGIYQEDNGKIYIQGQEVQISSPREAQQLGIAMIHQELSYIPEMTVAENIFLSREPGGPGLVNYTKMNQQAAELMQQLKMGISPKAPMRSLKVADQQMVEIAKAISLNARVIIMDEPTSAITDKEVDTLFSIIENLKEQGKAVIYISHKMDEVFRICDEVTVLRDGGFIGTWKAEELNQDLLVQQMVGRQLEEVFPKYQVPIGDELLRVENLGLEGQFKEIGFSVRRGEILGVAGLVGAGRSEVMRSLFGLEPADKGSIVFEGEKIQIKSPSQAIRKGIAYVTEDRKKEGIIPELSVGENITLSSLWRTTKMVIQRKLEKRRIESQMQALNVRASSAAQLVGLLSGGNQQKVILAKWFLCEPKLLILDEPTRGIDVGAKAEIYKIMCDYVAKGNSIIMVSSEMPEVMGMADRIVVLSNRQFGGELNRDEFTQENIMKLAIAKL